MVRATAPTPSPDITARAAIRVAALELFAERGIASVSVRDIAAQAGVSPALLFHHYGSKGGLCEAVDEWIAQLVTTAVAQATANAPDDVDDFFAERFRLFGSVAQDFPAVRDYVARSLSEGGETGQSLFDRIFAQTRDELRELEARGLIRTTDDEIGRALLLIFLEFGPLLLRQLIEPYFEDDCFSAASVDRWVKNCTELMTHGIAKSA